MLEFASEITSRGLPRSVLEIDDRWSTVYGDFDFDPIKFPSPQDMVSTLHQNGFKVTLWIIPFLSSSSKSFAEASSNGFLVQSSEGEALFQFWQPGEYVAALDVTNPAACDWMVSRLYGLMERYGLDGFKFDAGEPCWLPEEPVTHAALKHPNCYTRMWVTQVLLHTADALLMMRPGCGSLRALRS